MVDTVKRFLEVQEEHSAHHPLLNVIIDSVKSKVHKFHKLICHYGYILLSKRMDLLVLTSPVQNHFDCARPDQILDLALC